MEWVQSHIAWFGGTNEFVSTMLVCGDSLIHLKMPMVAMQVCGGPKPQAARFALRRPPG